MTSPTLPLRRNTQTPTPADGSKPLLAGPVLLLFAFGGAVCVRVALAGPQGFGGSLAPGVVFGGLLLALVALIRTTTFVSALVLVVGAVAAVVVVTPALVTRGVPDTFRADNFPLWVAAMAVVVAAEEAFLRGVLYDAVARRAGVDAAILVAAVAFGLMHAPFYGWSAVPVDTAVGLVLGVARTIAGTWTAPALAHGVADIAGWWML